MVKRGESPVNWSKEWWEGYSYLGPRSNNPYKHGAGPWLLKDIDNPNRQFHQAYCDWLGGWQTRFYGETPEEAWELSDGG